MHVAFVSQPLDGRLPPPTNSIGILSREFARHLAGHCRVTVFCVGSRFRKTGIRAEGVEYRQVPVAWDSLLLRLLRWVNRGDDPRRPLYASSLYYVAYGLQIALAVRRQGIDVVHIWNNSQFIPMIRRFNPGITIALHMECEWLTQLDVGLLKPRLVGADLIIGCSQFVTERIKERFPDLADRCTAIYNGVDVERFVPAVSPGAPKVDGGGTVLYVGRVSPEKGSHVLIEAFALVAEALPTARLELAGAVRAVPNEYVMAVTEDPLTKSLERFYQDVDPGSYERCLRDRISSLGMERQVTFHGDIANADLPATLHAADVFVFPSVWEEPFGIPPVEAMAAGVPVVATKSGGMNETVIDGVSGLLVERDDPKALADAILALLSDPAQRADMGAKGRERALALFSYDVLANQLLELYQSCRHKENCNST